MIKKPMPITEEMNVHEKWYKEAEHITIKNLPKFIKKLTENYNHDYGTICHAMAAAAIATVYAINKSDVGYITGFQSGAIMWEFIKHWGSIKGPARLLKMENMLYPQYEKNFKKISKDTAKWLREEAQKKLKEHISSNNIIHPDVKTHWEKIIDGWIPFGLKVEHEDELCQIFRDAAGKFKEEEMDINITEEDKCLASKITQVIGSGIHYEDIARVIAKERKKEL